MDNKKITDQFLEKIKQNKKYKSISDDIIISEIEQYFRLNPKISSPDKQAVKDIRAKLHRLYSSYQTKKKRKRELYLKELKTTLSQREDESRVLEITNNLLSLTLSTKERLLDYQYIYKQIFKITGEPKTIIDLGCGLNPLSFPFMNLKKLTYYAYDIDIEDINFLNQYFKIIEEGCLDFQGKAEILDIRNLNKLKKLPESDIIFMFKLFDLLDKKTKKQIILVLMKKTKFIIVSFATKTLTRKPMKLKQRTGFENYLKENNLKFEKFEIENEGFYVVSKD